MDNSDDPRLDCVESPEFGIQFVDFRPDLIATRDQLGNVQMFCL